MNVQEAARRITAAKVLADAAKTEAQAARQALTEHMRQTGTERVRVTADDEANLGAVSLSAGRLSVRVDDEAAFVAWVERQYPDQVRQVPVVAPGWRDRLLAAMSRLGDPVDPDTGEIVPGVSVERGDPYLTVRPTAEARERMREVLADAGLLAIEEGQ